MEKYEICKIMKQSLKAIFNLNYIYYKIVKLFVKLWIG